MSAKKRSDDGSVSVNPFAPDMTQVSPEFNMGALLENFEAKKAEGEKRKVGITERIAVARKNIARIEAMIESLTLKSQQESGQTWVIQVVKPLADEIQKVFSNATIDITSVLPGAVTMTLCKEGVSNIGRLKNIDCKSITLVQQEEGVGVRDYTRNTGEYPDGSIGAISGFNHPVVPVSSADPISFLVDWILK